MTFNSIEDSQVRVEISAICFEWEDILYDNVSTLLRNQRRYKRHVQEHKMKMLASISNWRASTTHVKPHVIKFQTKIPTQTLV